MTPGCIKMFCTGGRKLSIIGYASGPRQWMQFDDELLILATDPNSKQMDHDTFIEKYEWHVRSYLSHTSPYGMQP
jgi:hypothetical protein